jgi:probable HAF family extracellular repeat protein
VSAAKLGEIPVFGEPERESAMLRLLNRSIVLALFGAVFVATACHARIFRWTDLGTILGGGTIPKAINNKGQIVGDNYTPDATINHAFLWQDGVMTDLGTLGGDWADAADINDNGVIVGTSPTTTGVFGFEVAGGGSMTEISQLAGATGINNDGVIVGVSADGHPAVLDGGGLTVLPSPGSAGAVNDSGWVVGLLNVPIQVPPYSVKHAFIYRNGVLTDLGTLSAGYDAVATAINDSGLVVGSGKSLIGAYVFEHACEWRNDAIVDIHVSPGPQNSYCTGVNKRGDIVGQGYNNVGGFAYFPYYHFASGSHSLTLANDPGWQLVNFLDINDSGQIAAGAYLNGVEHGLLLDPVHPKIKLVDFSNNPAKNDTVAVYRVFNDRPTFSTSFIGTFPSDSNGIVKLPEDSLNVGDMFKVELDLGRVPSVKHIAALGTQYRYTLDNAQFDSLGVMSYDTLTGDTVQTVTLGHTTMAYNLVVSIEWDVDLYYIQSTQMGFQKFSDYLYDVSDGQLRLDTVAVYSNGEH